MSEECAGCGSSQKDREDYRGRYNDPAIPVDLKKCPHCGAQKCCMCDMGDDVECMSCDNGCPND